MSVVPIADWSWQHQPGSSMRMDVMCFAFAFVFHLPLVFVTFDMKGAPNDRERGERLVSVELIDPELEKPPPPPPPPPKKRSFLEKLFKREPPPPPPKKVIKMDPKKLDLKPKDIKLDPKLKMAKMDAPKLKTKAGFKTKKDPKLVQRAKRLSQGGVGVTPLSAKKLGVVKNRQQVLKGRQGFKVTATEKISGIGGDGPALTAGAPTLQIKTSKKGSREKFSSARLQPKTNKGRIGKLTGPNTGDQPKLGLKDRIIARDANIGDIGRKTRTARGSGGTGSSKQNRGSFGSDLGKAGGVLGGTGSKLASAQTLKPKLGAPAKVVRKKKGPLITGPLKNRAREKEVLPEYPYWAQSQGIEATVVLAFRVTAQGFVKDTIEVVRTSGYHKLDMEAKKALKKWKWVAVNANREEVGQITFTFELD